MIESMSERRRPGQVLLSVALALCVVIGGTAWAAPVPGTDVTYTTDADFDQGTLLNVNHTAPNNDQLQLNKVAQPFPFVNIAASARGTMVRIEAGTGNVIGEFLTSPNGMGRNPSRTTVDLNGNVWVANRDEFGFSGGQAKGSVTRVGLITGGTRANADGTPNPVGDYLKPPFGYNTCADRNGDGLIKTSRGLGTILPWTNAGSADTHGGVSTADDECIINYTRVTGTGTRTIAIDANNDAWVGGTGDLDHEKVSGVTGLPVPGTQFNRGCGGYGGLIDSNGVLWSARTGAGLLRFNPGTMTGACLGNARGDYGLAADPNTGHIWQTFLFGNQIAELDAAGSLIGIYPHGNNAAQGVAVDGMGNVWVAHALFGATTVGHLRTDGTYVGNVTLPGGVGPTGVAVDANGMIWVANINSNNVMRIDPNGGPIGGGGFPVGAVDLTVNLGPGAGPYNYSDMTGFVAFGTTSPQGTWSVVQDSGTAGNAWGTIRWNTEAQGSEPPGSSITVEARADDVEATLGSKPFAPVSNGVPFALTGRYIEVRATLKSGAGGVSPVLSDLQVKTANHPPVVDLLPAGPVNEGAPPIALTAVASDPDGDPLTYAWAMLAGSGSLVPSGSTATFSSDDGPGVVTVQVTVSDGKGGQASDAIDIVVVNVPPPADTGPDQVQYWGLPVSFAGSVSDPSMADTAAGLNPTWTFGDLPATTVSGTSASHVYADPGIYTATLSATDKDGGTGSDSAQVTINKRGTSLAYTGGTSQVYGFPTTLSAQLSDMVDSASALLGGLTVTFTVGGNTLTATTDGSGAASVPAPALLLPGTYEVAITFAETSHYLGSQAKATLVVSNTAGKVTAGTLRAPNNGRGGFNVMSDGTAVTGELQFQSDSVKLHAHTMTALAVAPDQKSAWFAGTGTGGESFVAYVEDNGEPGVNDKFQLWIDGVLMNGDGSLTGGNIQIHK